jgi:hypothetical protein
LCNTSLYLINYVRARKTINVVITAFCYKNFPRSKHVLNVPSLTLFAVGKCQLFPLLQYCCCCRLKGGTDVEGGTPLEVIKVGHDLVHIWNNSHIYGNRHIWGISGTFGTPDTFLDTFPKLRRYIHIRRISATFRAHQAHMSTSVTYGAPGQIRYIQEKLGKSGAYRSQLSFGHIWDSSSTSETHQAHLPIRHIWGYTRHIWYTSGISGHIGHIW